MFYAHSRPDLPKEKWQTLEEHLAEVGSLAGTFTRKWNAEVLGVITGRYHDLGKAQDAFLRRLEGSSTPVDHSTSGALFVKEQLSRLGKEWEPLGMFLAYPIAGHHTGLPNGRDASDHNLFTRLQKTSPLPPQNLQQVAHLLEVSEDSLAHQIERLKRDLGRYLLRTSQDLIRAGMYLYLFVKMLYSALVDADFLDTERFMDPGRSRLRGAYPSIETLHDRFFASMERFLHERASNPSPVDAIRGEIYQACLKAAREPQGFFSLTVPTGGGKTLSSFAFALTHARTHHLDRVIYVIPYTSIIEQNADVLRRFVGDDAIIEHHSNYESKEEVHGGVASSDTYSEAELKRQLATENWDAPVIVTTSVQFFESLFSHRTSKNRKLHNIARSVVIFDEAQTIPREYLLPILRALEVLVHHFGVTVVFCTATQPALDKREGFDGIEGVREIIPDPQSLARRMERVHPQYVGVLSYETLVDSLAEESQVLCIVDTRKKARNLFSHLSSRISEGRFHLCATMCPTHRSEVLRQIRDTLSQGKPCRVVTTQLIEAGVDVDFPVVYRSIAGIDSLAQAAGRCNREGKLERGRLLVFELEGEDVPNIGDFRPRAEVAREVIRTMLKTGREDEHFLSLRAVRGFFEHFLWRMSHALDKKEIIKKLEGVLGDIDIPYEDIGKGFHIIDEPVISLYIPYDERATSLLCTLRTEGPSSKVLRALQRYVVQVHEKVFQKYGEMGAVEEVYEGFFALTEWGREHFYDPEMGLLPPTDTLRAEDLIV